MTLPTDGLIGDAVRFATDAHAGVTRADGVTPYITHPIAAASLLYRAGEPAETVAAAVLHDVIEDCGVTREALAELFGEAVASLVSEVTFPNGIPSRSAKILESIPVMSLAAAKVKMADALSNLADLPYSGWPDDKAARYRDYLTKALAAGAARGITFVK